MTTFSDYGLCEPIRKALAELGHDSPTLIQQRALPVALAGHDLIACAQTGSGKTAVFGLPLLQRLQGPGGGRPSGNPRALVLVPTRELAIQVDEAIRAYGRHIRFRTAAIYGGVGYGGQLAALRRGVDLLVATPGRLLDLLERRAVNLSGVNYLVLDEADRMLDLGFLPQVRRVVDEGRIPRQGRQTLLFSATMPAQIAALARDYLTSPQRIEAEAPASAVDTIEQRLYPVSPTQKDRLLAQLLRGDDVSSAIIFARTRRRADRVARELNRAGLTCEAIHSDVAQNRRERVLWRFREGDLKFLAATDVASRGLDVPHLSHVVNYDVPNAAEEYVHRIGRTGRAGRNGTAITLYSRTDEALWQGIEHLTGRQLQPVRLDGFGYERDTSEPVLTRRQQAEINRKTSRTRTPVGAGRGHGRSNGGPSRGRETASRR